MVWDCLLGKELRGTRAALWSGSTHKHLEYSLVRSRVQVCLLSPLLPTTLSCIQLVKDLPWAQGTPIIPWKWECSPPRPYQGHQPRSLSAQTSPQGLPWGLSCQGGKCCGHQAGMSPHTALRDSFFMLTYSRGDVQASLQPQLSRRNNRARRVAPLKGLY